MDIRGYIRVIRDRWILVLAGLLAGLLVGGVLAWTLPPEYSSETTLYATAPVTPGDPDAAYSATLLEQQKAKFYVGMITGPGIGQEVSNLVGGQVDAETASSNINAQAPADTPIIMITAEGSSPEQAVALADAAGRALIGIAADVERATGPPEAPAVVLRVVQAPTAPAPASLPPLFLIVLGVVLGLIGGCVAALARHAADGSVRSVAELSEVAEGRVLERVGADAGSVRAQHAVREEDRVAREEAFGRLATTLGFLIGGRAVLAVSAPREGEGTTATVCDLAAAMARAGHAVVVIDADVRRPGVEDYLGLERGAGLVEVLWGGATVDHQVRRSPDDLFDVLGSGYAPTPARVIPVEAMESVLSAVGPRYDRVLIATPPINEAADAATAASLADRVVLVVREGGASRPEVAEAARRLQDIGAPVVGSVLVARRPPRPARGRADTDGRLAIAGGQRQLAAAEPAPVGLAEASDTAAEDRPSSGRVPSPRPRSPEIGADDAGPTVSDLEHAATPEDADPVAEEAPPLAALRPLTQRGASGRENGGQVGPV